MFDSILGNTFMENTDHDKINTSRDHDKIINNLYDNYRFAKFEGCLFVYDDDFIVAYAMTMSNIKWLKKRNNER